MNDLINAILAIINAIFGKKTEAPQPTPVPAPSPPAAEKLIMADPKAFFTKLRVSRLLGSGLEQSEVNGINNILAACRSAAWPVSWVAYALATAFHETAGTMQPIREYGNNTYLMNNYDISGKNPARAKKMGNTAVGDGVRYCGRGLVQLTWKVNYAKAGQKVGVDLVNHPELAMDPQIAARIMVEGMRDGWFTGCDIADDLPSTNTPATKNQFVLSRDIINGKDKAQAIADEAVTFQEALIAGGW